MNIGNVYIKYEEEIHAVNIDPTVLYVFFFSLRIVCMYITSL